MWECVNALVGLRDVWWREVNCGIEKGRRETVEGLPCYGVGSADKDCRKVILILIENQEVIVSGGWFVQMC